MRQDVLINVVCLAVAAIALGVGVWVVFTGQITNNGVDGLFVLSVCLVTILVFGLIPAATIRSRMLLRRTEKKPAEKMETATMVAQKHEERS
ncbi:MAG TPA: hypothetical protein VN442_23565 [Bryobacteraceae bacterium]|nr:hypothetical protein [Bryobacteraceae bacterium]